MSLSLKYQQLKSITRAGDWRFSFIPHIFGNLYLWILIFDISFNKDSVLLLVMSLLTSFGFAALGYFINEYFDQEEDSKAGKINKLYYLNGKQKLLVLIPTLLLTFLPWAIIPFDNFSIALIVLQVSLFIIYSIPQIRIKRTPIASGIVDAAYAYIVPMLLSFHSFYLFSHAENYFFVFIILYSVLLFFVGFRNITIHQINDIFKDKKVGIKSLPMILGVRNSDILLKSTLVIEAVLFFIIAILLSIRFSSIFLTLFIAFSFISYVGYKEFKSLHKGIIVNRPFRHLTDSIYQIWFPIIALFILIFQETYWLIILPIHLLLLVDLALIKFYFRKTMSSLVILYYQILNIIWHKGLKAFISFVINNLIYLLFKIFGIDLKKKNISAIDFLKTKLGV